MRCIRHQPTFTVPLALKHPADTLPPNFDVPFTVSLPATFTVILLDSLDVVPADSVTLFGEEHSVAPGTTIATSSRLGQSFARPLARMTYRARS
jgi:hypothetical protein